MITNVMIASMVIPKTVRGMYCILIYNDNVPLINLKPINMKSASRMKACKKR